MGVVKGKKRGTSGSGDGLKVLGEARDVDPRCVNASNPFHKCADYCSQNMSDSFKGSPRCRLLFLNFMPLNLISYSYQKEYLSSCCLLD